MNFYLVNAINEKMVVNFDRKCKENIFMVLDETVTWQV